MPVIYDSPPRADYTAGAGQTVFSVTWNFFADTELKVWVDNVEQIANSDYTVSGAGSDTGGTVTFTTPLAGGEHVAIMGDIPIERTKKANVIQQVAAEFAARDELALVIATEGTRKSDGKWRSGFYHIARAANVPIVPAFADNANLIISFGPPMMPTGNYGEDLLKIAEWFRSKLPDYERFKVLEQQARDIIAGKNDV